MFVPDAIRLCVVFVGVKKGDGRFIPKATGFLVGAGEGSFIRTHLVTAEHVIVHINQLIAGSDDKIAVRLNNSRGGTETIDLSSAHWWGHPDLENFSDVAATPFSFAPEQFDQAALRLRNRDLTDQIVLGLMHGHWGLSSSEAAVLEDAGQRSESVNVGVGIVVPTRKIVETLYQEGLVKERVRLEAEDRRKFGAVADVIEDSEQSTTADNPSHREDFTRLVSAAAKRKPPADRT